jgi:hypothetical protein
MMLQYGRSRTLPGVLHILSLERNLIYVRKMSDAGVHTLFQKDSCKMVRGVMVLMRGVWIETLYKLLGSVDSIGCNNIVVSEVDLIATQLDSTPTNSTIPCLVDPTMLWHQGWDILGKKDFELCTTKVWSKVFLIVI